MWFSPLKGAHLTLGQLDKTLPVDGSVTGNDKIERGSFMYITTGKQAGGAPRFTRYTAEAAGKPNAVPYIALMGYHDFQAGMAGNIGQAVQKVEGATEFGNKAAGDALNFIGEPTLKGQQNCIGPRITGISILQPAEYQTTAYDTTAATWYVGQPLTINNEGKLTPFDAESPTNIVGYVTEIPTRRWVNDLGSSVEGARISGGYVEALSFSTAWIPVAETAANVAPLNVGAPKVSSAASAAGAKAPAAPAAAPAASAAPAAPAAPAGVNKPQGK